MMPQRPSFSGHQSFPFRYPWLKKGIDGIASDPRIFGADDAMVRFGVGKNMVASMRHWGLALGVLQEPPDVPGNRGRSLESTELGNALFTDAGWGPVPGGPWNPVAAALAAGQPAAQGHDLVVGVQPVSRRRVHPP